MMKKNQSDGLTEADCALSNDLRREKKPRN